MIANKGRLLLNLEAPLSKFPSRGRGDGGVVERLLNGTGYRFGALPTLGCNLVEKLQLAKRMKLMLIPICALGCGHHHACSYSKHVLERTRSASLLTTRLFQALCKQFKSMRGRQPPSVSFFLSLSLSLNRCLSLACSLPPYLPIYLSIYLPIYRSIYREALRAIQASHARQNRGGYDGD